MNNGKVFIVAFAILAFMPVAVLLMKLREPENAEEDAIPTAENDEALAAKAAIKEHMRQIGRQGHAARRAKKLKVPEPGGVNV